MNRFFLSSLFITLIIVSCHPKEDPGSVSPKDLYESCCGAEPVEFVHGNGKIYIPNVFTANADGKNDVFYPFVTTGITKVENLVISDGDGTVLYEKTLLDLVNPAASGWFGLKPDGTYYKGLFKYKMSFVNDAGQSRAIEGSACCIVCDSAAVVFKGKAGCFYPIQYDELSGFNASAPNHEMNCFEH